MIETAAAPMLQRKAVRQFIKFCIVGVSSFVIDFGFLYLLHRKALLHVVVAKTISFILAVTNGYYWNRRWTFRAIGQRKQHEQYAMFLAVNVVGWILNVGIVSTVLRIATGTWSPQHTHGMLLLVGTVIATAIVVFWNFFANRHWTFKSPEPPLE